MIYMMTCRRFKCRPEVKESLPPSIMFSPSDSPGLRPPDSILHILFRADLPGHQVAAVTAWHLPPLPAFDSRVGLGAEVEQRMPRHCRDPFTRH